MAALAAGLAAAATAVRADEVVLKNGDRLTGQFKDLTAGKVTITVLGLGDVKVDAGQIATMATDGPVDVRLKDGTAEKRRLFAVPLPAATTLPTTTPSTAAAATPGAVVIEGGLIQSQRTDVGDITAINPPGPQFTGSITAGLLLIRGNASTDTLNLGVNVARKSDQDTVAVIASYLYGRTRDRTTGVTTTTAENWQAEARYDYNFTPRTYGFLDALVRKDRIAFLDLRFVPSGGFGYKFFTGPELTLNGELGLAWVYEHYTNDTPTREDVSARGAYHVGYKFSDSVSAFHDLEYLQSLQRGSHFNISTDVGLHAQLTKHFFGEAKVTLLYDSSPANGALKNDVFYAVNLGYNL